MKCLLNNLFLQTPLGLDYKDCLIIKNEKYSLPGVQKTFSSLRELTSYYQHNKLILAEVPVKLARCCPPRPQGMFPNLWIHVCVHACAYRINFNYMYKKHVLLFLQSLQIWSSYATAALSRIKGPPHLKGTDLVISSSTWSNMKTWHGWVQRHSMYNVESFTGLKVCGQTWRDLEMYYMDLTQTCIWFQRWHAELKNVVPEPKPLCLT